MARRQGVWSVSPVRPASTRHGSSSDCPGETTRIESPGMQRISPFTSSSRRDRGVAELFGGQTGDRIDKFDHCEWSAGPAGMPILAAASAWFVGRIVDRFDVGDHVGHLLEPISGVSPDGFDDWLSFSDVHDLNPGHEARPDCGKWAKPPCVSGLANEPQSSSARALRAASSSASRAATLAACWERAASMTSSIGVERSSCSSLAARETAAAATARSRAR